MWTNDGIDYNKTFAHTIFMVTTAKGVTSSPNECEEFISSRRP
jgi:hypothetical protein